MYKTIIKNKKAFEIPFTLIFAIVAGTVILLLAIYGASRFINTSQQTQYSEAAVAILNLLNPIVNDIESTYVQKPLTFSKETRIYLGCSLKSEKSPIFGKQTLAFSEQSGFLKKWPEPGINVSRYNKYIFSDNIESGKILYLFSKPFYAGFRVDDLVIMSMEKYCFVNPPAFMVDEIENKGYYNLNISTNLDNCQKNTVKVCFNSASAKCNMTVFGQCVDGCEEESGKFDFGYVQKQGKTLTYSGNLLYAAIFSSPEIYECNVKRLGKKISELGKVYLDEAGILATKNCNTLITSPLTQLISLSSNISSSASLISMRNYGNQMDKTNCDNIMCRIYDSPVC